MAAAATSLEASRPRPLLLGRRGVAVAAVCVTGIALRVWIDLSILGRPNSDESVVGLMVIHAMHGDISTFFWGSAYGGPHEVLLSVPVFWVAGPSYLALRVVPNLLRP